MGGPLAGVSVVELRGIGPGPFAGMMLADMGADVIRVNRIGDDEDSGFPSDVLGRGRRSLCVDLKRPEGVDVVLNLAERADALIEGFRPGVTERLGVGPDECLARNEQIVYGRITGWGQDGPYSRRAGHDINYIALAGALEPIGREGEAPVPPLNLVGDFGGGGMLLAFGIVAGLFEARRSGRGQVVDAAMVDGAALLTAAAHGARAAGTWNDARGTNVVDTGAPFYNVYETSDGKYISVGAIESQFYSTLLDAAGVRDERFDDQLNRADWPAMKERLAAVFRSKTRDEWCRLLERTDACFAPVLSLEEAPRHGHNVHRGTFQDVDGVVQPSPAPRFSRTPAAPPARSERPGGQGQRVLTEAGFATDQIEALRQQGIIG